MNSKGGRFDPISAGISVEVLERLIHLMGFCQYKLDLATNDINLTLNTTRIVGYNLDSLPNSNDTKHTMIYKEDMELVDESIASVVCGGKDHYHITYRMNRRDNSLVWIEEVGVVSDRDGNGKPLCVSALSMDLTRLKNAEAKARHMESEIGRMTRSIRENTLAEENRLLRAANAAGATIISGTNQDYEVVLIQALQMLGESLDANYAGIWRNTELEVDNIKGKVCCFLRSYWSKEARSLKHSAEHGGRTDYFNYDDIMPGLLKTLETGRVIFFKSDDVMEPVRRSTGMKNVTFGVLAPFILHDEFWGTIVFTRDHARPFTRYEAETVMSGAVIIAASVSRNEDFGKINMARDKAIADTNAKSEFLSRMSHELRTPLNAIIGLTGIALKESDHEKAMEYIKKVETSSHLLLSVINDVLDMSKIEVGKLEYVLEPFDFIAMLRTAETIIKVKTDEKGLIFKLNIDKSMTEPVVSDEHRLLQVIVNLLGNAVKFTPRNGCVTLSAFQKRLPNGRVKIRVEVQDTGIGLTREQQGRLFRAFEQADGSITRQYGGSGLGLAISKRILNALGGDIWVVSKPNMGSCFFFELEAEPSDVPVLVSSNDSGEGAERPGDSPPDWSGRRLLLVEDVDVNREIVEIMLDGTQINIVSAENGKQALEVFTEGGERFDVILMDVQMPVMDGLTATGEIRALGGEYASSVPIIAMTANAFQEDVDMCAAAGMNGHMAKPFSPGVLFGKLREFMPNTNYK